MLLISESYCESRSLGKKPLWRSRPDQRYSEKVMFAGCRALGSKAAAACWGEFYLFWQGLGRSWCCRLSGPLVCAGAGSQQPAGPGAGTARSGSVLPRRRSRCTARETQPWLPLHTPRAPKAKREPASTLHETFRAKEVRIRCAAVHQSPSGPTLQRHMSFGYLRTLLKICFLA